MLKHNEAIEKVSIRIQNNDYILISTRVHAINSINKLIIQWNHNLNKRRRKGVQEWRGLRKAPVASSASRSRPRLPPRLRPTSPSVSDRNDHHPMEAGEIGGALLFVAAAAAAVAVAASVGAVDFSRPLTGTHIRYSHPSYFSLSPSPVSFGRPRATAHVI